MPPLQDGYERTRFSASAGLAEKHQPASSNPKLMFRSAPIPAPNIALRVGSFQAMSAVFSVRLVTSAGPFATMPLALTAPVAAINGRTAGGVWSFLGQQGFPVITVPAGFTTEVYDRVRDPSVPMPTNVGVNNDGTSSEPTRLVGPVPAKLPVGIDFAARPFGEPMLLRIASAYEAATHHRIAPTGFGPLKGEP